VLLAVVVGHVHVDLHRKPIDGKSSFDLSLCNDVAVFLGGYLFGEALHLAGICSYSAEAAFLSDFRKMRRKLSGGVCPRSS